MAKHDVRVTKGAFKLKGKVTGTKREDFFKNKTTQTGKDMNTISFGVKTSDANMTYVRLQGMTANEAKFNKYDKNEKKNLVETISWDDRSDFNKDGFEPQFGVRMGINRNEKGDLVDMGIKMNEKGDLGDKGTYFPYDACQELKDKLVDDMSVFVEGQIEFSSYVAEKKDGTKEKVSGKHFKPSSIYSSKQPIDFDAEDFSEENAFKQEIIYMGIEKSTENDKDFIVKAKIVTFNSVEDTEFIIKDIQLANLFKKNLKPYHMIEVMGRLTTKSVVETVEEETWGSDDVSFGRINTPKVQEMVITKAKPSTIDKETYSEKVLDSIIKADEDFGKTSEVDWESNGEEDLVWN